MKKFPALFNLIGCILICQLAGIIGSLFTATSIPTWYLGLNKPFFNPPNYVFGPVWVVLYSMIGVSLYLILTKKSKYKKTALIIFLLQLVANTAWSIIFFGFKNPPLAFFEILLLWFLIVLTLIKFRKISKVASILLVPYLLWVTFASLLNLFIWVLN